MFSIQRENDNGTKILGKRDISKEKERKKKERCNNTPMFGYKVIAIILETKTLMYGRRFMEISARQELERL